MKRHLKYTAFSLILLVSFTCAIVILNPLRVIGCILAALLGQECATLGVEAYIALIVMIPLFWIWVVWTAVRVKRFLLREWRP